MMLNISESWHRSEQWQNVAKLIVWQCICMMPWCVLQSQVSNVWCSASMQTCLVKSTGTCQISHVWSSASMQPCLVKWTGTGQISMLWNQNYWSIELTHDHNTFVNNKNKHNINNNSFINQFVCSDGHRSSRLLKTHHRSSRLLHTDKKQKNKKCLTLTCLTLTLTCLTCLTCVCSVNYIIFIS